MLHFIGNKPVQFCDGLSRRDFLRVGALSAGALGLTLPDLSQLGAANSARDVNCILLFLVGGPSHIDTFDLKPNAPENVRGPFRPIHTNVPGIDVCEHLPLMSKLANRFALVRSVNHTAAPIHETGHQLMQTGRLFRNEQEFPHYGSVLASVRGEKERGTPPFVVLPGPIESTGVNVSHGQTAGNLGADYAPMFISADPARTGAQTWNTAIDTAHRTLDRSPTTQRQGLETVFSTKAKLALDLSREREDMRSRYGRNTFGQSVLLARRLVETGVRLVTVNMFDTVFNHLTWDCHADGGMLPTTLRDYAETLCPMFDQAYSALLEDLHQSGMLSNTMVLAMGEFGRTPKINPRGGRDHWTGAWSVLFAGAGIRGGQVIGSSDQHGAEVRDRPVTPAEIAGTVYRVLGIRSNLKIPGPDRQMIPLCEAEAIREMF